MTKRLSYQLDKLATITQGKKPMYSYQSVSVTQKQCVFGYQTTLSVILTLRMVIH